ncbi:MAG TPA: thiol:disulfide interchange protein DsbA/DsbL [Burkholderiales bacterium]|jgi:thiol:disulfide interchange protein DsbA
MPLRLLSIVAGLVLAFSVSAQGTPSEGIDYLELKPPQPTESAGKIEVIEFFWYRCPHCYDLEPSLESWVKGLPRDVRFRRVPGVLSEEWAIDARIFYVLEALGQVDRLHRRLFDAIHQQGGVKLRGNDYAKWVAEWLSKQGVDMKKYDELYRSFTVQTRTNRAIQMARAYRLDGVPTLGVQGRYVTIANSRMLSTTDFLIGEVRRRPAKSAR